MLKFLFSIKSLLAFISSSLHFFPNYNGFQIYLPTFSKYLLQFFHYELKFSTYNHVYKHLCAPVQTFPCLELPLLFHCLTGNYLPFFKIHLNPHCFLKFLLHRSPKAVIHSHLSATSLHYLHACHCPLYSLGNLEAEMLHSSFNYPSLITSNFY